MNLVEKSKLISLLNRVLGQIGKQTSDSEITYICPFHKALNNVDRKKFGICLDTGSYNCFACSESGMSFKTLFKKLKVDGKFLSELSNILGKDFRPIYTKSRINTEVLELPQEFKSMSIPNNSAEFKHAFRYLISRNITRDDILRYNIGYCDSGLYRNRILIPSYDKDAKLNFFSARDFLNNSKFKYLLSPWSKNIIGFELFINWSEPITLVEGAFDAISIRNNVIPLFGKSLSDRLKESILENDVKTINVCLDSDAIGDSLEISNYLMPFGIDVKLVEFTDKDPSIIGFEGMLDKIKESKSLNFYKLLSLKMNI